MSNLFDVAYATSLKVLSLSGDFDGSKYGDGSATGGSTSGDNVRTDYFDRAAIEVAVEDLIYGRFVDQRTQQRNSGKTFKISRYRHILDDANSNNQGLDADGNVIGNTSFIFLDIAYATEALATAAKTAYDQTAEGIAAIANNVEPLIVNVTNGGGNAYGSSRNVGDVISGMPVLKEGAQRVGRVGVTRENFSCALTRRGNFIEYSDEVELFSDHNMVMEYKTKLARMAIEVRDDDTQLGMIGSAGVRFYQGTATSIDTIGENDEDDRVTYDFVRKMVKRLKKNLAIKNTSMIAGSVKFGTERLNSAFYAIVDSDIVYDLESIAQYKPIEDYGYAKNLAPKEVGAMHELRFIETNRAMAYLGQGADVTSNIGQAETDGKYDVHNILIPTKGSYATVGLQGAGGIKFKAKAPGTPTQQDPYGVLGLHSYNYWFAGLALQPEKILCAAVSVSS